MRRARYRSYRSSDPIVALASFSDMYLRDLVVTYVKPLLASLTVGGIITMIVNWIKFHSNGV